jgi:hypothetical protein
MGFLNKERIALLVALVISLYGFATVFSGEVITSAVPDVPPPDPEAVVPNMNPVSIKFLENSFDYYWVHEEVRNPWTPQKTTSETKAEDIPLFMPRLRPAATIVPGPPYAPRESIRPVIRQVKPPVSIEETPAPEGENGDEEGEE